MHCDETDVHTRKRSTLPQALEKESDVMKHAISLKITLNAWLAWAQV